MYKLNRIEFNIEQHSINKISCGLQAPDIQAPPPPPAQPDSVQQVQQPAQPTQQMQQQVQQLININWSHIKPEFSGKPEEDAEAHFL